MFIINNRFPEENSFFQPLPNGQTNIIVKCPLILQTYLF
jgi:hypothetical protein